jgi:tRNA (guanine37-N1)-methyltransferase
MPLRIDVITIFPAMIDAPTAEGIVGRARAAGIVEIRATDLRDFSDDKHRSVDDAPFGGGPGMVMKAEPFARALESVLPGGPTTGSAVALLSPRGRPFAQQTAARYASLERLVLLCGRYEGVDERVREALCTEEVSVGDFVLTGGEAAALCVIEATVRLLPGALGDALSAAFDSFAAGGILDFAHYTRPAEWRGHHVPQILLSGDHARVWRHQRKEALGTTLERRPELLRRARLSAEDEALVREIEDERRKDVDVHEKVGMEK